MTATVSTHPRVLIVGNFLSKYGSSRQVCEELALKLTGCGYSVLTTSDRQGRLSRLRDELKTIFNRRNEYDVAQVDVFSGPAFFLSAAAARLLKLLGKPFILTLHGGGLPEYASRNPHRVRDLLRAAAAVTAPSRYLQSEMAEYHPDIQLLPNALPLGNYHFRERRPLLPKLTWLRAFHSIYAPIQVPRVVSLLKDEFPAIHASMTGIDKGDGSKQATESEARQLGVAANMTLHGAVPKAQVPLVLDGGDIFLNTTTVDNTPVSVLEALACGACVVSTNVGGIPYLLDDERTALLVPPGDARAMAQAVRRLLTDAALAKRLAECGREAVQACDWARVLPAWQGLFQKSISSSI